MNNKPMKRSNNGRNSSYESPLWCPTNYEYREIHLTWMNALRLYCRWYLRVTRSAASTTDVISARGADETPDSVTPEDPGERKYPRSPTANKNVGMLPTWPAPIGPLCQNSNALTPPRPEPVWFSLVHSSPSRLALLTASTRTNSSSLLSICDHFFKILSQFHGWLHNPHSVCLRLTQMTEDPSWSQVVGVGVWVWVRRSLPNLHCRI